MTILDEGSVPERIYFSYGGKSEKFYQSLEFVGLSPVNSEFGGFLMSDLGRQVITQNKLSIHVESRNIFYENYNTGENFYNFLLTQQNDDAAFIPKIFCYRNSFDAYVGQFLEAFSIDDIEKDDLYTSKNSKYIFYCFNDFIKAYVIEKRKIIHSRKMLDSVGLQRVEEKSKQILTEKIIHGIEFENPYNVSTKKNPEIIETGQLTP